MNESDPMRLIEQMYEDIRLDLQQHREDFMNRRDNLEYTEQNVGDLINEIKTYSNFNESIKNAHYVNMLNSIMKSLEHSKELKEKANECLQEISMEMEYLYAWSIILIIFVLLFEIIISYISKKKDLVL